MLKIHILLVAMVAVPSRLDGTCLISTINALIRLVMHFRKLVSCSVANSVAMTIL